jgi:transglutaminase-like putative cysteine protease
MVPIRTLLDLFGYVACLLGVLPLYIYLDYPLRVLFPVALLTGFIGDRRRRPLLGRRLGTLLSVLAFVFYGFRLNVADVAGPAANLLVALLVVRLLSEKQPRHYLQIFVLAIFALAGSSLLTLSPMFLPALVLLVTCITLGLVLLTFRGSDPHMRLPVGNLRSLLAVGAVLPVGSLLLMLVFFAILPRTQVPLWNFLNPSPTAVSGFSDKVRPGAFARNAASGALAFRVESEPLAQEDLYWRGIVLNVVEGGSWLRQAPPEGENVRLAGGRVVEQVVYPETREDAYLFGLDPTEQLRGVRAKRSSDLTYRRIRSREKTGSYRTVSRVGATLMAQRVNCTFYLQVPTSVSQRLRDTAARLAAVADTASGRVAATEEFFRRQKLVYATSDLPDPDRAIEAFLFEKKRGYCEFFAGSFALLLRLEGVPARLVGGYMGGSRNDLAGYYTVTEEMAHVWVEALVDGSWRRIDPSRLANNAASAEFAGRGRHLGWGRRLLDAADYYWTRAVISYDLNKQFELLHGSAFKLRNLAGEGGPHPLIGWLVLVVAGLAALFWVLRRVAIRPEERLLNRFLRLVNKRFGIVAVPHYIGLQTLAERTGDARCREFVSIFGRAVYRDRSLLPAERGRLRRLLKELRDG